jgi:hypothetical protein
MVDLCVKKYSSHTNVNTNALSVFALVFVGEWVICEEKGQGGRRPGPVVVVVR